eukprot:gene58074-biopygen86319
MEDPVFPRTYPVEHLTWSFGSICFGSLIVAILKMIKFLVRMMQNDRYPCLNCIIYCILDCLDQLMQY